MSNRINVSIVVGQDPKATAQYFILMPFFGSTHEASILGFCDRQGPFDPDVSARWKRRAAYISHGCIVGLRFLKAGELAFRRMNTCHPE